MLWSGALIRAHCHPDQQHESLIDQRTFYSRELLPELTQSLRGQHTFCDRELFRAHWLLDRSKTSCDQELLWELIDSLIDRQTSRDQELFSELIDPPINQKILAIRSSYQCSLTPWSTNKHVVIGSSYQSSLSPRSTSIESLIDQQTIWNRELLSKLILRSEARIIAHWLPDRSKTSCNQEPLSELVDSLIIQQTCCYWRLLSELIPSPIDQNLLAIRSSFQSPVTQELINNPLAIGSFNQNSLAICGTTGEVTDTLIDGQGSCDWELFLERV